MNRIGLDIRTLRKPYPGLSEGKQAKTLSGFILSALQGSNLGHFEYKSNALPTELRAEYEHITIILVLNNISQIFQTHHNFVMKNSV